MIRRAQPRFLRLRLCLGLATCLLQATPSFASEWVIDSDDPDAPGDDWVTLSSRAGPPLRAPAAVSVVLPVAPAPDRFSGLIESACQRYGLRAALVTALIHVESRFQPAARSPKGALGLMQIMPATAARYGVSSSQQLLNPEINIDVGTRYLRDLQEKFDNRVELVLAAYNAGEGAVIRHGHQVPPYRETQNYVRSILALQTSRR